MGGCATKPKVLESKEAPAPVEASAPSSDVVPTDKAEIVLQETQSGSDTKKEEPLVDVTEAEAPKEEATTNAEEAKPAAEAVPKEAEVEVKDVVETVATTEAPKAAETVDTPEAPKA